MDDDNQTKATARDEQGSASASGTAERAESSDSLDRAPQPGRRKGLLAIVLILIVLAAPVVYLAVRYTAPHALANEQTGVKPQTPAVDIAALEQAFHTAPTASNELNLSAGYLNQNQPARAQPLLDEILKNNPRNAAAWNNYCILHMKQQDYTGAVESCSKAVEIAPDFSLARNNLKWAGDERQKALKAIADDEKVSPAEQNEALYLRLGLNDLHVEQYDDAIHAWTNMLALNPKSAVAANNIGIAYMLKHQYADGAVWFQKALAADASNQLFKNNLAWATDELAKSRR